MPAHRLHRVAVVLFADVPGATPGDSANRFALALQPIVSAPLPAQRGIPPITVLDLIDLTSAARNGYLTVQPAARLPHE
ncbi:hypothetical protein [Pseudofrankia inefficax]|uniref:Uncharacterized protein n=1 Tax=Pseudofrankia inefficax (strain DSM 45817 / CECT 9037 / DDB 130130 / EuI1c) TaxID=298654 RepID=E3IX42_PSEI1|nr:hypothetical protein [Pseudofrankia inefficax]ADP83814.1 hypothetical protein FraEuI1c_5830 [Pseudofrankia inefficax]